MQAPIPIWIGGNSKLSRRRVAERAQGWMPMSGSPELSRTTRTPMLGSLAEVADAIRDVREAAHAAGRTEAIDILYSYQDRSIGSPTLESDRHREAFAEIERAGATWVVVSSTTDNPQATMEFLEAYGSTYLA